MLFCFIVRICFNESYKLFQRVSPGLLKVFMYVFINFLFGLVNIDVGQLNTKPAVRRHTLDFYNNQMSKIKNVFNDVNYNQFVYKNILETVMESYADEFLLVSYKFMHDNDPKHTSRLIQSWLQEHAVDVLGSVISALAEMSSLDSKEQNEQRKTFFIPYRDSVLTWLLKDSLGGNSKTIMIAAISPADCNYGETLSTLRYANRAKNIINKPTINEDPNVKLIRELRNEISKLKALMFCEQKSDMLAQQIHEKETREKELTEEWTGKWREAQAILREQTALGLRKSGAGVVLDSDRPHLVAIDDDPLSTGVTLYHLKEGVTTIGSGSSKVQQDIELRGTGMEIEHCTITFQNGIATLTPKPGANIMLNNQILESPAKLSQGCIIFLGKAHVFRFNDPAEAAELRKGEKAHNLSRLSLLSWSTPDLAVSMENLQGNVDDDRFDIDAQRQTLEKEKEQFEKKQEQFEKNKQAFERRKRSLEEAQAKLESEKRLIQKGNVEQMEDDWQLLTEHQRKQEQELKKREQNLILKRQFLEQDRLTILGEINGDCNALRQMHCDFLSKFRSTCNIIAKHANDISFPDSRSKLTFQELAANSQSTPLSNKETDILVDILNKIRAPDVIQKLVNHHRKELAESQAELNRRVQTLCARQKTMEEIDQKLIGLVKEQENLSDRSSSSNNYTQDPELVLLKETLAKRTQEELKRIEQKKLGLTLNLKKINLVEPDATTPTPPTECDKNPGTTLSSATYHTAPNSCSTPPEEELVLVPLADPLMSDTGLELRLNSFNTQQEEIYDELSRNEGVLSDSHSSSSIENRSPISKKNKRRDAETLQRLAHKITMHKNSIVRNLDNHVPKEYLNQQIAYMQELQRRYMCIKYGCTSGLSPALEHPLQNMDSPSPIKPIHTGSTSVLYTSSIQMQNSRLPLYNNQLNMYRSMPSIATDKLHSS
ncbi:hypothetical protein ABEB36_009268 [Hypothenemus hampei]|uniref:Kinesin motor domain-containing protein n=1 Tax=Hypothenemus hampei TaxID=57062 RepID=A0ABD1EG65_HYPHA